MLTLAKNIKYKKIQKKDTLFFLFVSSNSIQTTANRGAQICSLGSSNSNLGQILLETIDQNEILLCLSIQEKLYIWMLTSGISSDSKSKQNSETACQTELVACLSHHSNKISAIKLTKNKEFLISAGFDGYVNIYSLYSIFESGNLAKPVYTLKGNQLEITNFACLNLNPKFIKLTTVGNDNFLRVWELDIFKNFHSSAAASNRQNDPNSSQASRRNNDLNLVHSEHIKINFNFPIKQFAMDSNHLFAFVTTEDRSNLIQKVNLHAPDNHPSQIQKFHSFTDTKIEKLEISFDNTRIFSLDNDFTGNNDFEMSSSASMTNTTNLNKIGESAARNTGSIKIWHAEELHLIKIIPCYSATDFVLTNQIPRHWFDIGSSQSNENSICRSDVEIKLPFKLDKFLAKS